MKKSIVKIISVLLAVILLTSVMPLQAFAESVAENSYDAYEPTELSYTPETEPEDEPLYDDEFIIRRDKGELASVGAWDGTSVYGDGVIYINSYQQLSLIGSDTPVTDADLNASAVGTGSPITLSGSGTAEDPYDYVTYSNDATYYLANDIPLPSRTAWSVPAGFSGMFTSAAANGEDNSVLRTADTRLFENGSGLFSTDTVYYHNVYQMKAGNATLIRSTDYDALTCGSGSSLTRYYYNTHNYILASNFTAQTSFDVTEYITLTNDQNENYDAIVIRNYNQLKLVGLGENTLVTETVNGVTRTQTINYPSNAVYYLANDITLADDGWQLPAAFTGSFTCDPTNEQSDSERLYVRQTLSTTNANVYIQNIYQLDMLGLPAADRSEKPVLNRDYDPEYFGAGSPEYLSNLSTSYLTYGTNNTYILSRTFSNERVDQISTTVLGEIANTDHIDGRDFFTQTTAEVGGDTYILIGDRQQLDAIGTDKYVYGPVYKITQRRSNILDTWQIDNNSIELVYPGDADLIADVKLNADGTDTYDFSTSPLFSASAYHALGTQTVSSLEREVYCASDGSGGYNIRATTANANRGTQRYTKDAKYIVFRDIDMTKTDKNDLRWQPLMFSGEMYGVKAEHSTDVSTLWSSGKTVLNMDTDRKPEISDIEVVPSTLTQSGETRLNLNDQTGVGFFGTLTGNFNASTYISDPVIVKNIKLRDGTVNNPAVEAGFDQTLVNGLVTGLATVLGTVLDPVLSLLIGKNVNVRDMLTDLLDARAQDPTSLATGAFAGRVMSDAVVEDCEAEGITVTTVLTNYERDGKIVGKGGFVGHVEGETTYSGLSNTLGGVGTALSSLLNLIPGLGLGDLITVLLDNALPLGNLVPTGYSNPTITNCTVNDCALSEETGKYGVGGFAGSTCGAILTDCTVENCGDLTVNADHFGGGFSGISRDAIIKGTLSGLGINIVEAIHPQSELIRCSIENSSITVSGGEYLGGFVGSLANSYGINDTIDENSSVTVTASGDYAGGFVGDAQLGTLFGMSEYLNDGESLLSTVTGLVTGLLGSGSDQSLLDLGGVSPSAIMGCQLDGELSVSAGGDYVGGILGRGDGVYVTSSSQENISLLSKYRRGGTALPITAQEARDNEVNDLVSVSAGGNYAGGIAGYLTSANVGGLLGSTLGVGQYLGFTLSDTTVHGTAGTDDTDSGYTVSADGNCAGGGVGWAVGGDVYDVALYDLASVTANNRAAGFVGATGPGELLSGDGLDLKLLGISILSIDNLLSLVSGVRTTYKRADVTGVDRGFTVSETGKRTGNEQTIYTAGGFAAEANSVTVDDCHVYQLKSVTANDDDGIAGGFVARSAAGGLAGLLEEGTNTLSIAQVGQLLNAVPYLIPEYNGCDVSYVNGGYVEGDVAGGFTGEFQSGNVNTGTLDQNGDPLEYETGYSYTSGIPDNPYAVNNIHHVTGSTYGGGFGGKVYSGALISAGGGLNLLGGLSGVSLNVDQLLGLVGTYVPTVKYAGVNSPNGFTVEATTVESDDQTSGSAGGFIGYASGAQVSYSDVNKLKHTVVVPPDDLEAVSAPSYFDGSSSYSVTGGRYAGGYVGDMDIGTAASLGGGLKLLGNSIQLSDVLSALSVVVTTVEHSNVYGAPGGFAILATGDDQDDGKVGMSGGFAGSIYGGHVQDSHSINFSYIIGEEAAGGYVGNLQPGNVANLLGDGSVLSSILDINSVLASLIEDFVPTIRNSTTTCIPCGGAVRAQAASDNTIQRGCAGGYCGHNEGGHIWGYNSDTWKEENDGVRPITGTQSGDSRIGSYTGPQSECAAIRIRSVYGYEYAGGFTGFMESADTANLGGASVLGGLIQAGNILSLLSIVYPTEKNTAVYGPLSQLDTDTWNAWVTYVGRYGGYGAELARSGEVTTQQDLDEILSRYIYGCNVVAGRSAVRNNGGEWPVTEGGSAGGYVGYMVTGVISNGQSYDMRLIRAMRSAGGYAGKMQTGSAANFGGVSILGLPEINLGQLITSNLQVFVPTIRSGTVRGWQSGLTVTAFGADFEHQCGYAGGYVGSGYGAQIWGDRGVDDAPGTGCDVINLRFVKGTNAAGGYAGILTAGAMASVNTDASSDLLQGVLNTLLGNSGEFARVLQATVTTVRQAQVNPDHNGFGFTVSGVSGTPPRYAGGFAGVIEAAVVGDREGDSDIVVNGLRSVDAVYYAGGFFGLADVTGVAEVSGSGDGHLLGELLSVGEISAVDAFRPYVYYSEVNGVDDGIIVRTYSQNSQSMLDETRYSGCAGGFGGAMMNGTVTNSSVSNLNTVSGMNYTGGFIGHMGKSGVVDADNANVSDLLGLTAGVFDVFGTHTDNCEVHGIDAGAIISSAGGAEPIAGGFVGYADLSRIDTCSVDNLKLVSSDEIAGGFVGKTDMHYLINVSADSPLVQAVLGILNLLLRALLIDDLENINLIGLNLGIIDLQLLSDGNLVYVNLLGLRIGISLVRQGDGNTGTAIITIGDSSIELPYNENGIDMSGENAEVVINLIKGNRTRIENSSVKGIAAGYDVYGGTADNDVDGSGTHGYAGGFVGYNNEGHLLNNTMEYCDVVRGAPEKVGPFSGGTSLQSVYSFNTLASIEGENNRYPVYRKTDLEYALTSASQQIGSRAVRDTGTPIEYNRFDVTHLAAPIVPAQNEPYYKIFERWKDAVLASDTAGADATAIDVYASNAKAVLMLDIPSKKNDDSLIPTPGEAQDPCEETLDLTIQKIWDDRNDMDGSRPSAIRVRIWQHRMNPDGTEVMDGEDPIIIVYENAQVIPDIGTGGWFTIDSTYGRQDAATWTRVIEGLPVGKYQVDPITGDILTDPLTGAPLMEYYYTYTVEEAAVEGYSTEITYDDTGTVVSIKNTHRPLLPHTGGWSDLLFILLGIGVILTAVIVFRRKKTSAQKAVGLQGGHAPFRPPRASPFESKPEINLSINKLSKKGTIIMTKRLFAVLMAVAIVLAMTVSALAATGAPETGSLTVSGNELTGKTVDAYRVFTASWVDANEVDANDDNIDSGDTISYVLDSAWNGYFSTVPAIAADTSNKSLSEKAANYVANMATDSPEVLALAKALKAYAAANSIAPTYTSAAATNNSVTITGMVPGYYLAIPQSGSTSTDRETDATLVNVPSEASASWEIKSEYPTVEKTVDGNNKETTAQIGDIVTFTLTSAVPDMTEYTTYALTFHDTLSAGLTYQYTTTPADGVTVTIGGDTVAANKYTVTYNSTTRKLDIAFNDIKTDYAADEGKTIIVSYSAMLNENAVIAGTGNKNTANVEYSNDPSDTTSTGTSTDSETTTYTYQITIDKHDNSATPVQLPGAVFTLKDSTNAVVGLIATGTPNEYRVAKPGETAVTTVTTPDSGLITIKGLEAGTYYLEEVTAPTGYNKLGADITIVVAPSVTGTAPDTVTVYGTPNYTVDGTDQANSSTINVVNTKGAVLPTTGSIGTIGLTIAGVAIVILGIVFTSRKKKTKTA